MEEVPSEWQQLWSARERALTMLLGEPHDRVYHSLVPLDLGGSADVMAFPSFVRGWAFVTADLVGCGGQPENSLGAYELMICTRELDDWAPSLISRLAPYTLEATIEPGETMDMDGALPEGTTLAALVFTEPDVERNRFVVQGRRAGLLLCVGITRDELEFTRQNGLGPLESLLREKQVYPFTDLRRDSVLGA